MKTNFPTELPWDFTFTRCEYYVLKQSSAADIDLSETAAALDENQMMQSSEDSALANDANIQLILLEHWHRSQSPFYASRVAPIYYLPESFTLRALKQLLGIKGCALDRQAVLKLQLFLPEFQDANGQ